MALFDTLSHATGLFGHELFAKAAEIVGGPRRRGRPPKPNGHAKSTAADHIAEAAYIWNSTQDPRRTATERYLASRHIPLPPTDDLRQCELSTDYAAKLVDKIKQMIPL